MNLETTMSNETKPLLSYQRGEILVEHATTVQDGSERATVPEAPMLGGSLTDCSYQTSEPHKEKFQCKNAKVRVTAWCDPGYYPSDVTCDCGPRSNHWEPQHLGTQVNIEDGKFGYKCACRNKLGSCRSKTAVARITCEPQASIVCQGISVETSELGNITYIKILELDNSAGTSPVTVGYADMKGFSNTNGESSTTSVTESNSMSTTVSAGVEIKVVSVSTEVTLDSTEETTEETSRYTEDQIYGENSHEVDVEIGAGEGMTIWQATGDLYGNTFFFNNYKTTGYGVPTPTAPDMGTVIVSYTVVT